MINAGNNFSDANEFAKAGTLIEEVKNAGEINNLDNSGKSLLYMATEKNNLIDIKLLLENGADLDIEITNKEAKTANIDTPRKLMNTSNPSLLSLSKIKGLANDKLNAIEKHLTEVAKEIGAYSLTPTTMVERDFKGSIDNPLFTDSYKNYSVIRFGLNVNSSKLLQEVESYKKCQRK